MATPSIAYTMPLPPVHETVGFALFIVVGNFAQALQQ